MCPGNHKYTEEKLRGLGVPELFVLEARKMHEEWCETHDFDALVDEILGAWEYAKKVMEEKNSANRSLPGV